MKSRKYTENSNQYLTQPPMNRHKKPLRTFASFAVTDFYEKTEMENND